MDQGQEAGDYAKWVALLKTSADRGTLTSLGGRTTIELMLVALEWASGEASEVQHRLIPLIASIPQTVFSDGFGLMTETHMRVLRDLAAEEPIQHHLTLLMHGWAHDAEEKAKLLEQLRKQIAGYDVEAVSRSDYDQFKSSIDEMALYFHQRVDLLNKALALAWNTSREDLIDRLTTLKESWLRYMAEVVGKPASEMEGSQAYQELDAHFQLVFGNELWV